MTTIPFGVHRGKSLEAVRGSEPSYLTFIQKNVNLDRYPIFKPPFLEFMALPETVKAVAQSKADRQFAQQQWR